MRFLSSRRIVAAASQRRRLPAARALLLVLGLLATGGLIAFVLVLGRTFLARTFTHEQAVSAVVVSYYWHFVDVVWIALFLVIYILK